MRSAAALIIGNELLTGKIADQNLVVLARTLRRLGVTLRRVLFVPDELETIASELRGLSDSHDLVFTSGGVGPTHDDVTVDAVALAFGVDVERCGLMEGLLRDYYGAQITDAHLRMARIPVGARRICSDHLPWPTVVVRNVWVLPGVPQIFSTKMQVLKDNIEAEKPFLSVALLTTWDEGELKPHLDAVVQQFKDVDVGSYPRFRDPTCRTKITFDGQQRDRIIAARAALAGRLPPESVVGTEG